MATTAQRLIVNVETGTLLPTFDGVVGSTQPRYTLGDTTPVEIYLVKSLGSVGTLAQVPFPAGATVKLGVGVVNQQPTAGGWHLEFDGDETAELAFNITAAALETALNGLSSITSAGGVTVAKVGSQYQITFASDGARVDFTGRSASLVPASVVSIETLQEGDASTKEVVLVNLAVSPVALVETFTDVAAPSGSYSATGWALAGGVRGGGYKLQLTFTQDGVTKTVWTDTIATSLGVQDVSQLIFDALVNAGWGFISGNETTNAWGLRVSALDTYQWRVDFTQPIFTTAVSSTGPSVIGIDVTGVTALAGKTGTLSIATAEAVAYLGTEESRRAVLEVQVEAAGEVQTLLQAPCELVGQVIADGAFAPLVADVPLGEAVANDRFLRRDADQTLDATTKDQLWENLTGVTTPTGVDLVAALTGAVLPSASNVFVTESERNPFDQDLNTTSSVKFAIAEFVDLPANGKILLNVGAANFINITDASLTGLTIDADGFTFKDSTTQTTAAVFYDQPLNTTDDVEFASVEIGTGGEITFPDATTQTSAPVFSSGTGQSGGSGSTIHNGNYPDEITIVIGGVTYAMPARIV